MNATEHLEIIYERVKEKEAKGETYGLRVFAINHTGSFPLTERFSGLENLKKAVQKAEDIRVGAVKIHFYGSADRRAKESDEPILIPFDPDFNRPAPAGEEKPEPRSEADLLGDDEAGAIKTLGGFRGLLGYTQQLSEQKAEINMLKMQHQYETDRLRQIADDLRSKILKYTDQIESLEKELDKANKEKDDLSKQTERLAGIEEKAAPREMINTIAAQALSNFAVKVAEKNPGMGGLLGFLDPESAEPEMEEATGQQQSGAVEFEEEQPGEIDQTVNQLAEAIKQFDPQYINKIVKIIQFARDIDERHAVIFAAINQYVSNLNQHNHVDPDSEN